MPAAASALVCTVEYWYLFFSELIYGTFDFLFYPSYGDTRCADRPHFICEVPDPKATVLHVVSHPHSRFFLLLTAEGRLYVWRLPHSPPSDSPSFQSGSSPYPLPARRSELEQYNNTPR
ncbi:unnamed protein product [Dibothriocephalus latus]|uniref:Uncharacterized protein n=1 Tax=Dibothriocephalus latus TaxID=60516 RepID=A0A3P7LFT3_DIBLA|nr:unnamed protein product [Dibothriocephalus latus]